MHIILMNSLLFSKLAFFWQKSETRFIFLIVFTHQVIKMKVKIFNLTLLEDKKRESKT